FPNRLRSEACTNRSGRGVIPCHSGDNDVSGFNFGWGDQRGPKVCGDTPEDGKGMTGVKRTQVDILLSAPKRTASRATNARTARCSARRVLSIGGATSTTSTAARG